MQFRLLENDVLPLGWSERFLRSAIEEGFAVWNRVSTSTFRAELRHEVLVANRRTPGINEIGFADSFHGLPSPPPPSPGPGRASTNATFR